MGSSVDKYDFRNMHSQTQIERIPAAENQDIKIVQLKKNMRSASQIFNKSFSLHMDVVELATTSITTDAYIETEGRTMEEVEGRRALVPTEAEEAPEKDKEKDVEAGEWKEGGGEGKGGKGGKEG